MVLPAMRSIVRRRAPYCAIRYGLAVLGLLGRAALLHMRVWDCAANDTLILRSPPLAGVSKDGPQG
jgi:hypothetical protein